MSGRIQAVSALDGRPLLQAQADGPVQASPLVVGNRLYIASVGDTATASGQLLALEADSGAVIWRQTTPDPLFASPVWAADRLVVAVTSQDRLLLVYNPDSGALEWEYAPES